MLTSMPTVAEIGAQAMRQLQTLYPAKEARAMSYTLLQHYSGLSHTQLHAFPETVLSTETFAQIVAGVNELLTGKPLQYIIGEAGFCGLPFTVNESVLIPRPETEELVHEAVEELNRRSRQTSLSVLDLCTGSGCIAVSVAAQVRAVRMAACDVSEKALKVARSNALRHHTGVDFFLCDILEGQDALANHFAPASLHAILSNPPYVRQSEKALMQANVLCYEPHLALFVEDENPLAFYHAIASIARRYLAPDGFLIAELNENLAEDTAEIFHAMDFPSVQLKKDLHEKNRFVKIQNQVIQNIH